MEAYAEPKVSMAGTIFVFGSNLAGKHASGAALYACQHRVLGQLAAYDHQRPADFLLAMLQLAGK
jgi:hypothetical protein